MNELTSGLIKNDIKLLFYKLVTDFLGTLGVNYYVIKTSFNGQDLAFQIPLTHKSLIIQNFQHVVIDRDYFKLSHVVPRKGEIVVDIGAFVGFYTVIAAINVEREGQVYSVEPNKMIYSYLVRNIELNRLSNIIPYSVAICPWSGISELYIGGYPAVSSIFKEHVEYFDVIVKKTTVRCVKLDSFLRHIRHADVLKMDIEGLEENVLKTSIPELWRVEKIVVEVHANSSDPAGVENALIKAGFKKIFHYISTEMPDQIIIYAFK